MDPNATGSSPRIRRAKRHLMSWGTGRADLLLEDPADLAGAATVVLEDGDHLEPVLASDLVGPGSVVLSPGAPESPEEEGEPFVVGYDGSLGEPGGDLSIDDAFFLQVQDYATSGYMTVIGATLVRVTSESDFEAFLEDAERARDEGVFADFVTDPAVQLSDLPALGAGPAGDGPRTRLYVSSAGTASTAPGGAPLGTPADGLEHLVREWEARNAASAVPCAVCLAEAVPEEGRAAAVSERPWAARYLTALAAVREMHARGIGAIRVSGFGGRLAPALEEIGDPCDMRDPALPVLLWTDDAAFVHNPAAVRTIKLDRDAGGRIEALLVCGSVEAAEAHADPTGLRQVDEAFAQAGMPLTEPAVSDQGAG